MRPTTRTRREGFAYVLAIILMAVFVTLGVVFTSATQQELQTCRNYDRASSAQIAAESGLQFALYTLRDCRSDPTLQDLPNMLDVVEDHFKDRMPGHGVQRIGPRGHGPRGCRGRCFGYCTRNGGGNGNGNCPADEEDRVIVPAVTLNGHQSFSIEVYVTAYDPVETDIPTELGVLVCGQCDGIHRSVGVTFEVTVDKSLLHYAMVSSLRIIARGNVTINGPVASSYGREPMSGVRNHDVFPLDIDLSVNGRINGTIGTVLSKEDFEGDASLGDSDFHDGINHDDPSIDLLEQMSYEEPEDVADVDTEDFDTSPLKAMTSPDNLPAPDAPNVTLPIYSLPGNRWENHNGTDKPALNNICVPKGTNPHFKNCRFTGITYIEVDENTNNPTSSNQNGVLFEDCIFEGPIITGVPRQMDWSKNCMQFVGNTQFRNSMIQEALGGVTLMAPNYNVNIGGSEGGGGGGDSEVCGLVIGGCVDMYNDIHVKGTVISMADLVVNGKPIMNQSNGWTASGGVCGSNIGNLDGSSDNVVIEPDPDNVIPLGIKRKYVVIPKPDSYTEIRP